MDMSLAKAMVIDICVRECEGETFADVTPAEMEMVGKWG
jgi:hypothetical protein